MKKILFIIALFFVFSCDIQTGIIPPELSVSPNDDTLEISSISDVTFYVSGTADEDLTRFKIVTDPYVYGLDTLYPTFTHSMGVNAKISIPDVLPELTDDSLITVTFNLSDAFNSIEIIKYLRVVSGYGFISQDSTKLTYGGRDSLMFYSQNNKTALKYDQITLTNFDMVFIYDDSYGFVLASPDAFFVANNLISLAISGYAASGRNKTKMNKFSTDYNLVDARFLYNLTVSQTFINDDGGNGDGISDVQKDDVIAFENESGLKGIIHITDTDIAKKSLSFEMKIQRFE